MKRIVVLDEAAREELKEAVAWYERERPNLGVDLADRVRAVIARIADGDTGSVHPTVTGVRRMFTQRFPYVVVFVVDDTRATVLAVSHTARHPTYWRARVP